MSLQDKINIKNKKAYYNYEFIDTYVAGIQLKGSEIKSIRNSKVSFADSFCFFKDEELWIKNLHIAPYENASHNNHDPIRTRKLLLNKQELKKLSSKKDKDDNNLTIVPTKLFVNKNGYAKLEIALAKGKKEYDKRESIKKRDVEREHGRKL
ncbi:MAG: SsrA-binding protein [Bacteroidetes bacterium]|nr:MAG: SsrA-binding protein [Bacteroidota bacterium]